MAEVNLSVASSSLVTHFDALTDPRIERRRVHPLPEIAFLAICATLCGANNFVAMETFGHTRRAWLSKYLTLPGGIPSHDTIGRVFAAIDPEQFVECFLNWMEQVHTITSGQIVNIDGKTARASLDRSKDQKPLHVVSAWAKENRVVLGQVTVDTKSNEIPAIPKLLELLELSGAIVTIDAMGCQKAIAAKIRDKGADYVLAVRGNQEHLEEDIINYFTALDSGESRSRQRDRYETNERGHGRRELRFYDAVAVPSTLRHRDEWKDVRSLCRATRIWEEHGESKSEVRYFISSLPPVAAQLSEAIRGHWGIENGLHWVLDMYFAEDRSRARTKHAAGNLALLRRWAVNLLRQDKTLTGGIENKRLQLSWSESLLEGFLGLL